MKKTHARTLVVSLVCMVIFAMSVIAVETLTYDEDGTYSYTYEDGAAGGYYSIIAVEGTHDELPEITEDNLVYIDQGTAALDGTVSFDNFIPSTSAMATLFVGGEGLDEPVAVAYLAGEKKTVSISVTGESGIATNAVVTLTNDDNEVVTAIYNSTTQQYEAKVDSDIYKLVVTLDNHLSYTKTAFEVTGDTQKSVTLKGGDFTNDGVIDFDDYALLIENYKQQSDLGDADGNGVVDFDDYSVLIENYKATAVVE